MDLPQPAVMVPKREKARLTMGELGTLFGLQIGNDAFSNTEWEDNDGQRMYHGLASY